MKKSRGSIFIFLFFISSLSASSLTEYSIQTNVQNPYQKQPVVLTFKAHQKNHTDHMFFLVQPKKSDDYKIQLLEKKLDDKRYHDARAEYSFLLFPLKSGKISVSFDFTVLTASDSAVAQSYVDDHDDSIAIQTKDTRIIVAPLQLNIKPLQHDVQLVGDFTLKSKMGKKTINQYESTHITYTLTGKGYIDRNLTLLQDIDNVTLFFEQNDKMNKAMQKGYSIDREYIYALSAKESFSIPAISIKAFSPTKQQYYTLSTQKINVKVQKIDTTKLLDKTDEPMSKHFLSIDTLKQYAIYLLIFISGFITAKVTSLSFKHKKHSKLYKQIQNAKEAKYLLMLLINHQLDKTFKQEVAMLEEIVYQQQKHSFGTIKRKILKRVK